MTRGHLVPQNVQHAPLYFIFFLGWSRRFLRRHFPPVHSFVRLGLSRSSASAEPVEASRRSPVPVRPLLPSSSLVRPLFPSSSLVRRSLVPSLGPLLSVCSSCASMAHGSREGTGSGRGRRSGRAAVNPGATSCSPRACLCLLDF
jgi:hypothetical protein